MPAVGIKFLQFHILDLTTKDNSSALERFSLFLCRLKLAKVVDKSRVAFTPFWTGSLDFWSAFL